MTQLTTIIPQAIARIVTFTINGLINFIQTIVENIHL